MAQGNGNGGGGNGVEELRIWRAVLKALTDSESALCDVKGPEAARALGIVARALNVAAERVEALAWRHGLGEYSRQEGGSTR